MAEELKTAPAYVDRVVRKRTRPVGDKSCKTNADAELANGHSDGISPLAKDALTVDEELLGADLQSANNLNKIEELRVREKIAFGNDHLLLEAIQTLSVWLHDRFKSNGIQYTIAGKKLDIEELFGVNGLLASFIGTANIRQQKKGNAFSLYLIDDEGALAGISPRLEGDPFDFESLNVIRDAIVQITNELKVIETDGIKTCSVDEIYTAFYDECQEGKIKVRNKSNSNSESASDYAQKMFTQNFHANAEKAYREIFRIRKSVLGEDHPSTIESKRCLVECLLKQGKSDVAQLELESGSERARESTITVCDENRFLERLKQEAGKDHEKTLSSLKEITKPKRLPRIQENVFMEIERIGEEQPNFAEATEIVLNSLHAQALSGRAAQLPPLLLIGPPGVGKTRYIKRISAVLGLPFQDVQLAGVTEAYQIAGLSRYWSTAAPGTVANMFVAHDVANPVFLLDEIDKAKSDEKGDPLSVIMLLLEKESSRAFKDAFLSIPIDASHASFIATANDVSKLSEPLISRFHCIEVAPLDYDGRCTMVRTTYQELLAQEKLQGFLDQDISKAALKALARCETLGGRELKREILLAMHRACREHKFGQQAVQSIALRPTHLRLPEIKTARRIGFLA